MNLCILLIVLFLFFTLRNKNKIEGAENMPIVFDSGEGARECSSITSPPSDGQVDIVLSLPQNIEGKFIDIDARDKYYLYAVTDSNEVYKCRKPCNTIDGLVNWELVPVGLGDYGITKIFSSEDFLWGLNDVGEPIYSFKENNEILDEFRESLESDENNEMNSYSELEPSGYCKEGLISINNISDVITANASLENCQALCNKSIKSTSGGPGESPPNGEYDGVCDYLSHSNSLSICNLYSDSNNLCENEANRNTNENFTSFKRNAVQLDLSENTE